MAAPLSLAGTAWIQVGTGSVALQCDSAYGVFVEAATAQPSAGTDLGMRISFRNALIPATVQADTANQPIWARAADPNSPVILRIFGSGSGTLTGTGDLDFSVAGDSEYWPLLTGMI